jgi:hypothetical protein
MRASTCSLTCAPAERVSAHVKAAKISATSAHESMASLAPTLARRKEKISMGFLRVRIKESARSVRRCGSRYCSIYGKFPDFLRLETVTDGFSGGS